MADYVPTPHLDHSGKYVAAPNHLAKLSEPILRLPIGGSASARVFLGTKRVKFTLRVPTVFGGTLTLQATGVTKIVLKREGKEGKELTTGLAKIVHDVANPAHGVYVVEVTLMALATSVRLSCTLVQTGTARDGTSKSAPPIIPWHFFFWPAADLSPGSANEWTDRSGQILDKLARSLGATGSPPSIWEHANHRVPYGGDRWQGHCHHAAPASAFFKQPAAHPTDPNKQKPVTLGGETFTQDELELIATEWFANYGREDDVFWLAGFGFGDRPAVALLKPSDASDHRHAGQVMAALEKGAAAYGLHPADVAAFIAKRGGPDAFKSWVIHEFGRMAARFYGPLQKHLYQEQKPINADMRAAAGTGLPHEVWNQVYFHMVAEYRELDHDDLKVRVTAVLFSNNDVTPADPSKPETPGLPADIVPGTNDIKPNASALEYTNVWCFEFDASGDPIAKSDYGRWVSVKNRVGHDVYAPRVARTPKAPEKTRKSGSKLEVGNPGVPFDLVSRGYLQMWNRYNKP